MASPMQPSATTQSDISKLAKKMAAKQQAAQNHRGLSSLPEDDPRVAYDEGSACLCSREPDLIREVGIIKKVHEVIDEDGKGAVRYSIKFKDGFLLTNVKPEDLGEVHGVNDARRWTPIFPDDAEYDAAVAPLLPAEPADGAAPSAKYEYAAAYKAVGNTFFGQGKHDWALRTYLACVQALQRIGFGADASAMAYDLEAAPVCIACFSNGALCALKLKKFLLAEQLCERGEIFKPEGSDLGKLLLRKCTAIMEYDTEAGPTDPERVCEMLEQAAEAMGGMNKPIAELLQRARKIAKERQKLADKALSGKLAGKGLSSDGSAKADAKRECDEYLRKGWAALLGTMATRDVIPPEMREIFINAEEGGVEPRVDAPKATEQFGLAAGVAARAEWGNALAMEAAHAVFGLAAAAAEAKDWQACAKGVDEYFEREAAIVKSDKASGAASRKEEYRPPLLGHAYIRFYGGMAHYNLKMIEGGIRHFEGYLKAVAEYKEVPIYTVTSMGVETVTELDNMISHMRKWAVSGRAEWQSRMLLARLKLHAAMEGVGVDSMEDALRLLRASLTCLEKAAEHAWDKETRKETEEEVTRVTAMMKGLEAQMQAGGSSSVDVSDAA